jgi:hypothetical protein
MLPADPFINDPDFASLFSADQELIAEQKIKPFARNLLPSAALKHDPDHQDFSRRASGRNCSAI